MLKVNAKTQQERKSKLLDGVLIKHLPDFIPNALITAQIMPGTIEKNK